MQAAKKLVLVDEFDREYKRLQRPAVAIAKTDRSLQLSDTLHSQSVADDRKVRECVVTSHRYLNTRKEVPEEPEVKSNLGTPQPQVRQGRRQRRKRGRWSRTDMDTVYTAPQLPGSFGGLRNLQRYSGRSKREVKKFLAGQDAYTLHKPSKIRFLRCKTCSKGIGDLFQIDLVDLSSLSPFNDGMRYLLTCIDVFTKRAWAVPVARKSARDIVEDFEKILADQKCTMVQSDKCTEFLNSTFQSMLKRHGIKFYTSENEDPKAAVVEQFNRTLKEKCFAISPTRIRVATETSWKTYCTHTITHIIDRLECPRSK